MKDYKVITFLMVTVMIISLLWFLDGPNPLMIYAPDRKIESQQFIQPDISYSISSSSTRTSPENTILPKTNMTVNQYSSVLGKMNTFNLWLLSLNTTHWQTRAVYQNTSGLDTPFDSVIDRDSYNHFYNASNYYFMFDGSPFKSFEFWIDTTNFFENYEFPYPGSGNYTVTVHNLENITMDGVGEFEAWKLSVDLGEPNFYFYEKSSGMFLSWYLHYVNDFWFNLTSLEKASLPIGYNGPVLSNLSPSNESKLASGSIINVDFLSPYGVADIHYNWDDQTNLTTFKKIETSNPVSDGLHNLTIIAFDNVGYYASFFLVYQTDNTLAGIILKSPRNGSQVRGLSQIELTVVSSNGSVFYNWDNDTVNDSMSVIDDSAAISIPDPFIEKPHSLNIFVKSIDNVWTKAKYIFFVDNTAPSFTLYQFENNSVQKDDFSITVNATENVNVSYSLNTVNIDSFLINANENHSIPIEKLTNGTYKLYLEIIDEAGNTNSTLLIFSIHSSDFDWNWLLISEETHSIDLYDENKTYWMTSSVVSKSNQFYNISMLTDDAYPELPSNNILGIKFQCELPTDIIFLTLTYPLSDPPENLSDTFPLYQWFVWDDQEWVVVETTYDQVTHSWKMTNLGYSQYFVLVDSGETTQLRSVVIGGGSIPAFEFPTIIIAFSVVVSIKKVKKNVSNKN